MGWWAHSYKSRGRYEEQLDRYYKFFPFEQLLVLHSESFFENPEETLRSTFDFLGLDNTFAVPNLTPQRVARNRTEVDRNVYEYLNDYFMPYNRALYQMLGRDFGW